MKKYISLFLYIVVLIFGLFIFTYKPTKQTEVLEGETATQESIEEEQYLSFLQPQTQNIIVKDGDTFVSILTDIGVEEDEAAEIEDMYKTVYNVYQLQIGQVFSVSSVVNPQKNTTEIIEIVTEPEKGKKYI
ncbi:MAG: hypothetical protein IKS23_02105, partial [Alphaproteobacteria bacterium]|nr:hypothetical protein [Alphaproteobacteria bacterium]